MNSLVFKVVLSYLLLITLLFVGMFLIRNQISTVSEFAQQTAQDNNKTVQLTKLVSLIYETDVINKQFLNKMIQDSVQYKSEIKRINFKIDSITTFFPTYKQDLDSLNQIIFLNSQNILKLRNIQNKNTQNLPQNVFLNELNGIIRKSGKLMVEDFVPNFKQLSKNEKKIATDYIEYLNKNIPKEEKSVDLDYLDSLISVTRFQVEFEKKQAVEQLKQLKDQEIQILFSTLKTSLIISDVLFKLENQIYSNLAQLSNQEKQLSKRLDKISNGFLILATIISFVFILLLTWDVFRQNSFIRKLELEKNEKANLLKSKEYMTNALSHDVKTPMHAILTYANLIEKSNDSNEIIKYSKNVASSSNYVLSLVQDLLEFSKIQSGKISLYYSYIYVNELINEISQIQKDHFKSEKVSLNLDLSNSNELEFWLDEVKIKQIINNLLSNAFKYTKQGEILIQTKVIKRNETNLLSISISDSGVGIPDAFKPYIFSEFSQARASDVAKGTGLGLFITKQLVDLMDGTIGFESSKNGTKFTVELPISKLRKHESQVLFDGSGHLFLIIDDDAFQLEMTSKTLKSTNANCIEVSDFTAQEAILEQNSFSLIITDIQMPNIDGFEVLKLVRNSKRNANTKVVAISSLSPDQIEGFNAVFSKSINKETFLKNISNLLLDVSISTPISKLILQKSNKDFSLEILNSYANNVNELTEMIQTFISQSEASWQLFEIAIKEQNNEQIGFLAHRLSNFYRMIQANDIVSFLNQAEKNPESIDLPSFEKIKKRILELFDNIYKEINPNQY